MVCSTSQLLLACAAVAAVRAVGLQDTTATVGQLLKYHIDDHKAFEDGRRSQYEVIRVKRDNNRSSFLGF